MVSVMPQWTIQQTFDLAIEHHQAGRLDAAESLYRQILAQQPQHAGALHYLGMVVFRKGEPDAAVTMIRQAIALMPNWPDAYNNLASVLQAKGQLDQAIAAYRQAIALNPEYAVVHYNLGTALQAGGQLDEAMAAWRRAIALQPDFPGAWFNLGMALREKEQLDEAVAAFHQAIVLQPNYPEAYSNLGNALQAKGCSADALAAHHQAVTLNPDYAAGQCNLGNALWLNGEMDQAIAACRRAIALEPHSAAAYGVLGTVLKDTGQVEESIAAYRQALALKPTLAEVHSNLLLYLHYRPGVDALTIAQEGRRWNQQHAEASRKYIQPHANDRKPERRLRIGYVSPNFHAHPVGWFMLPLLANHDRDNIKVFTYAQPSIADATTQRLRAHADVWRSLLGLSDTQAADLIRQDRIDILVDLALHTSQNRLLVFARKPAPVQATYLAYAGSSGLTTMDYRLSDPYLDPLGMDESIYSEQTIRLRQTYWCYQPLTDMALVPPPALHNGFITFGCLNNFCKVNEPLLDLWTGLLAAVPHSRLLLHAHQGQHCQRALEYLQDKGIDTQRISFAGRLPAADYFAQYQAIDIALDTLPFGGGTTTCDALWMGVPVLSLAGTMAIGRAGLSILTNAGLPELVAKTPTEYMHLAGELADDLPRLQHLRATLRPRMQTSPLMDAPRFARAVEAAYRQMWRKWCAA